MVLDIVYSMEYYLPIRKDVDYFDIVPYCEMTYRRRFKLHNMRGNSNQYLVVYVYELNSYDEIKKINDNRVDVPHGLSVMDHEMFRQNHELIYQVIDDPLLQQFRAEEEPFGGLNVYCR